MHATWQPGDAASILAGPGQPSADSKNTIFGSNLRQIPQYARSAKSARAKVIKRRKFHWRPASIGVQSGDSYGGQDSRLDVVRRVVCFQKHSSRSPTSHSSCRAAID